METKRIVKIITTRTREINHIRIGTNKWLMMELQNLPNPMIKLFYAWLVLLHKVTGQGTKIGLKGETQFYKTW